MQLLPRLQLVREVLVELARRPKEYPVGLDDQLVEYCVAPKSEANSCLYEVIYSRLS